MAKHDIQKSRHLLKRLDEEMLFLSSLMSQMESLSFQITFVSSGIKKTWSEIDRTHEAWKKDQEDLDS
jgi:hypothetical protein